VMVIDSSAIVAILKQEPEARGASPLPSPARRIG
jgi:uncharacterized protein with PIN domain